MIKKIEYSNGDKYEGELLKDYRHGHGIYKFPNGDILECEWEHNRVQGNVLLKFKHGQIYQCKWYKGRPIGNSKITPSHGNNSILNAEAILKKLSLSKSKHIQTKKKNISSIEDNFNKNYNAYLKRKDFEKKYYIGNWLEKISNYVGWFFNLKVVSFLIIILSPILVIYSIFAAFFALIFIWVPVFLLGIKAFITRESWTTKKERTFAEKNFIILLWVAWGIVVFIFVFVPPSISIFDEISSWLK